MNAEELYYKLVDFLDNLGFDVPDEADELLADAAHIIVESK